MYFSSRMQAGRMLARQVAEKYENDGCVVVALSDGGVVVGTQIAMQLHCVVTMLLVDEIELPREMISIAGISQDGAFSYNKAYAPGEIEEMVSEYRGVIEQEKLEKIREMGDLIGNNDLISHELIRNRTVILVSDGMSSGFSIDLALEYLKPIAINKLVVATPLASLNAVDRMHILADDIYCLSTIEDYITTDHYYDVQDVPSHEVVVTTVANLIRKWG